MLGRMPDIQGAHTSGQNNRSLGICFIGNFDEAAPPLEQWLQGVKLVRWLCVEFNITTQNIFPHNKFAVKTCPGIMFDIAQFKQNVQEGL
jgi:N-acetylmuramoyl-L-alanine amidase CwlA